METLSENLVIRPLRADDSLKELTLLIRSAYARLAEMGLKFLGTWQEVETTRSRVSHGECFVAELEGRTVGTVCLYTEGREGDPLLYRQSDVAHFGQLAVAPDVQELGLGSRLIEHVAERSRELGMRLLALDTAESADHLIAYYGRRGFVFASYHDWPVTNYRSVVMQRAL